MSSTCCATTPERYLELGGKVVEGYSRVDRLRFRGIAQVRLELSPLG